MKFSSLGGLEACDGPQSCSPPFIVIKQGDTEDGDNHGGNHQLLNRKASFWAEHVLASLLEGGSAGMTPRGVLRQANIARFARKRQLSTALALPIL